nr:tripartite motif-containing protein 16-like isoform X2 [Monopterus albus]
MLKRTGDQNASPPADLACAGPGDVACDFCCGTKRNKATVSCLTCLASYCPVHLKPHCSFVVLKTHQLVSATVPLQEKLCTKHNKLKEVYCQKDQMCICYLCTLDEHRGHSALSAAAERAKEQKQLIVSRETVQERLEERVEELNELAQALRDFKSCSRTAVESCDETIDELISFIKTKHTLVTQLIKSREETAVAQAEALQLQLEEEIARLHRRDTYLDQLSHTDDHIHFIQSRQTWARISAAVSTIDVVLPPMPKTREDLLRYCCPLTLDASSVSKSLSLSEDYQRVTSKEYLNNYGRVMGKNYSSYHDAPSDRFTGIRQVLCTEGLSERRYWEVTWVGHTWSVAVTYKDIGSTSSYNSEFGQNDMSWSLECSPDGYTFRHNSSIKAVSGPESCRVGVYLDYLAGTLSFYSVSDTVTLLHTESTTFTQPLYPGLGLKNTDS